MAQVPVLTVNNFPAGVDNTQHRQIVYGLVTFTGSGGYVQPGLAIDWTKMVNADGSPFVPSVGPQSTLKPSVAYFQPQDTSLLTYQYDQANNKLFAIGVGAQVVNTTVLGGVIAFEAHFIRGV